jgi:hypothetical protein
MSDRAMTILHDALWMAHPVLQVGIAAVMLRRGLHRKFKFFFTYILTQVLLFAINFAAYRYNYTAYFYLYWFSHAISVVLGFGVIHEVFLDVFRPFHTLRDLGTVLFKWAGLVMLLVAGVVSVSNSSNDILPWMQAIVTTERCVRMIQVGMVLFLLFFSHYVGVSRRQQSFGIALGFGAFALMELVLVASFVGDHLGSNAIDLINMAVYNASLVTWFGYVWAKSPARETAGSTMFKPQRWEQSLTDIHHPATADSLIPMFEGMVDRALSRTQISAPAEETRSLEKNAVVSRRTVLPVA